MKNTLNKHSLFFIVLAALAISACFSPWHGDKATITINLGSGAGRSLTSFIAGFDHRVEFRGPNGIIITREALAGSNFIQVTVEPGRWDIKVDAYTDANSDGRIYATGSASIEARAGQNTSVPIQMNFTGQPVFGWTELKQAIENIEGEEIFILSNDTPSLWNAGTTIVITRDITLLVAGGDVTITRDSAFTQAALFRIFDDGVLTLGGSLVIDGGDLDNGNASLIEIGTNSSFVMHTGVILQNNRADMGGAVFVNGGDFTMHDGTIKNNKAFAAGGVGLMDGTFTMKGGIINDNTSLTGGPQGVGGAGGVGISDGTFTLDGGTITNNTADDTGGGGVGMDGGTFRMISGTIRDNESRDGTSGGGIAVSGGDFTMEGGDISENTAHSGGGVFVASNASGFAQFSMSGGSILGNSATGSSGGGVLVSRGGEFTMSGGVIGGNNAFVSGGGVEIFNGLFIKSSGTIYGYDGGTNANTSGSDFAVFCSNDDISSSIPAYTRTFTAGPEVLIDTDEPGEQGGWDGGAGTTVDPFRVYTEAQLRLVGRADSQWTDWKLDSHYRLMADITLAAPVSPGTSNWTPIGDQSFGDGFTGTFDGRGHTINGLTITSDDHIYGVGFFGSLGDQNPVNQGAGAGVVRDLRLSNVDINVTIGNVGSIAGYNYGLVEGVHVSGEVRGDGTVGGLVGSNRHRVSHCSAAVRVISTGARTGGLVGDNDSATITRSFSTGNVDGTIQFGGLVGVNVGATARVENSYATGTVTGGDTGGGLVGTNDQGTVTNSYALGEVTIGSSNGGGLIGNMSSGTVENSIALNPNITFGSGDYFGRVAGTSLGSISNSYGFHNMLQSGNPWVGQWNDTTHDGRGGADVNAAQVKTQSWWTASGPDGPGFDFSPDSPWVWTDGFMPRLRNEEGNPIGQPVPWPAHFN